MIALEAERLRLGYEQKVVLDGIDLGIEQGSVTTLIGANGCGKSTLLKAFGRLLTPLGGEVRLSGQPLRELSAKRLARRLAVLPQKPLTPAATTTRDLVLRGRSPHQSLLRPWTPADAATVDAALAATGLTDLAERDVNTLSGGQLQRAWVALVLAQETPTILLDEPTTYLDLSHQLEVLRLVRRINRERGTTIVMVLHDLGLAARFSDRLVVLHQGQVLADGTPWQVLTPEVLATAFGLAARVVPDPVTGSPLVVPIEPSDDPSAAAATRHDSDQLVRLG
ncbi:iron complex transport system ATP-binding protein [Propionicimonas paludicola]|uniref:Iron complex transport system ATP-binding protein n=1 Tax=Propionicimonas paludicola TaxID=185243 RepID=A0A2A9CN26_9ACTN|nr:ABC transporter ATP-binding protein [Propionicimonas paludicola]PFG15591.1 iron complex transport system ATP-binding protein [Propionicimonas paludicola]